MKISLYLFSHYSKEKRAELVWKNGQFLALRQEGDRRIALYHLKEFFAEVWYSQEGNEIVLVRGFNSRGMLEPYLEGVGIKELMGEE
jgi:hypothetical protein